MLNRSIGSLFASVSGGGGSACSGEGSRGEAGDSPYKADRGQSQAEGTREAQDPAGAAAGVEEQNAGAAE